MIELRQIGKKAINIFVKVQLYLVFGVIIALFGFLAFRAGQIFSSPVDKTSLEQRQAELETGRVRFDEDTLAEVLRRSQTGPSTSPDSTGDPNPFD